MKAIISVFRPVMLDTFLWMVFNCLTAKEPLLGNSFTNSPVIPGTHLIDLRRMKG